MCHPAMQSHARRTLSGVVVAFAIMEITFFGPTSVHSENSIKLESKWVEEGESNVTLGIHLTNEAPMAGVLIVLEIRQVHVGSFIRRSLDIRPQGRLMSWTGDDLFAVENYYPYRTEPGPEERNRCPMDAQGRVWRWLRHDSLPDFIGEEALLYYHSSTSEERPYLNVGSDGLPGTGTPSLLLVFDVTEEGGAFII